MYLMTSIVSTLSLIKMLSLTVYLYQQHQSQGSAQQSTSSTITRPPAYANVNSFRPIFFTTWAILQNFKMSSCLFFIFPTSTPDEARHPKIQGKKEKNLKRVNGRDILQNDPHPHPLHLLLMSPFRHHHRCIFPLGISLRRRVEEENRNHRSLLYNSTGTDEEKKRREEKRWSVPCRKKKL